MRDGLGRVETHEHSRGVRAFGDGANIVDSAEDIGLMPDRHEACRRREQLVQRAQVETPVRVDVNCGERETTALRGELPRHDVAVMLHHGHDNAVTRLEQLRRV